uniref:Copine domain-containing protein n=1 Tax=Angiostrongylus cantonensis TaxID=6313 RepID=A0A0K0D267_ANGCA
MREPKEGFMLTNPIYKGGQKTCGQFDLVKCTELKTFSFLDYLTFGYSMVRDMFFKDFSTVLNFAFAIDFSDAVVTEDRQAQIDFANNVEFVIRSIGETLANYTRTDSFLAYGFGARIPPLYRESHEFCLNLETDPICVGVEGVVAAFRSTYMKAKPCTSAHFAHIIYHLAKSAQNATTRSDHNRPQYYILNIITRGAIDDVKETVQAAIFASKSPISIIFTG